MALHNHPRRSSALLSSAQQSRIDLTRAGQRRRFDLGQTHDPSILTGQTATRRPIKVGGQTVGFSGAPSGVRGGGGGFSRSGGGTSANRANAAIAKDIGKTAAQTATDTNRLFSKAGTLAKTLGQSSQLDIERNRLRGLAQSQQSLIGRGLGNTTIVDAQARGINADAQRAGIQNRESQARLRTGLLTQQAGAQLGLGTLGIDTALSSQNVQNAPNQQLFQQLLQQLAAQGGL